MHPITPGPRRLMTAASAAQRERARPGPRRAAPARAASWIPWGPTFV